MVRECGVQEDTGKDLRSNPSNECGAAGLLRRWRDAGGVDGCAHDQFLALAPPVRQVSALARISGLQEPGTQNRVAEVEARRVQRFLEP